MKLHLPKSLLVAVLAACVGGQTAWAGDWSEQYTNTYNILNGDAINELSTADKADDNGVFIRAGEDSVTASITTLNVASGKKLTLSAGYPTSSYDLSSLTIGTLNIADNGSAVLDVGTGQADDMQKVVIKSISGTISALTIGAKGELTIGSASDSANTAYTIQTGTINAEGSLTLAGGTTTIGTSSDESFKATGELKVKTGAVLKFADSDVLSWGSNKVTLEGGVWDGGETRQSVGASSVINLNGGTIKSAVDAAGNSTYGDGYAVLDFTGTGKIDSSGESSITGGVRVRNGNVTINVAENSALTIDTIVNCVSNGTTNTGGLVVTGEGTLKITSMAQNKHNEAFYSGSTSISDGATIEYAIDKISDTSTNDGSYSGTISGTGNIVKSGTGTVTLASVSNLDGDISVTGGLLDIRSLTANKTMGVSTTGGTLNIGSVVVNPDTMELSAKEGATVTQYYSMDRGTTQNSEGNGFLYTRGDYVLFNGYEWNGSLDNGLTVSSDGTNTYVTANTVGTTYYLTTVMADINATEIGADTYAVRGGTMNLTKGTANVAYSSGSINMAEATYMGINSGSSLTDIVKNTTGTGTILVESNAQIGTNSAGTTSSEFAGTIKVTSGTLNLGETDGQNNGHCVQLSQLTIELAGGTAEIFGSTSSLGKLSVTENANFSIFEVKANGTAADFDVGEIAVSKDKTLTITTRSGGAPWHARVNVAALTGEGNFVINTEQPNLRTYNFDTIGTSTTAFGKITNKETMNLGANGESLLNMGNVTNTSSATLNIRGNLAGTSIISGGTINLESTASISGDITFGSDIHIAGTIANTGSFTLSGNVTIADIHALKNNTIYSDNEGKDGYISSAIYYVVESSGSGSATASEGLLLNDTHTLTAEKGNLVARVENETPGGIYYVNTRDFTVDGTDTNAAKDATGYKIAAGKTLTISAAQSDSMTAGKILSEATGEGNIELNTTASYSGGVASQVEGKLTINGVTLSVGRGTVNNIADGSNISSFSSVDLKGGTLILNGSGSTINSLTVSEGTSTLTVMNENGGHQEFTLSGTTTLNADLDIDSGSEHGTVIMKKLTGSKNLSIAGGHQTWGCTAVQIEKLTNYTGTITVDNNGRTEVVNYSPKYTHVEFGTSNGDAAFSTLKGLEIKGNAYAMVYAKSESTIESLTLANGTLNYKTNYGRHTYTLDKVEVKGSGTIAINSDNTHYEGEVTIKNLKNAEGETSGELTLSSNFRDNQANVFNLEDGDFSGKIVFESRSSVGDGTKRLHALNLKDGAVASKAVINVEDTNNSSHMGIAVGADKVIVKGIAGTAQNVAIYSGVQAFKATSFTSDGTNRTLEIATNGESYTSSAAIKENVNLVKSGEGTQTFTGTVASSSVSVLGGGLSLTGIETLQLQDLVVKSGATLSVGSNNNGVVMVGSPVAPASTTVSTPSAKLEGGATINGSLNLSNASSLTLDGIGENSLVMINGDLILPVASETPTLTLSGGILTSLAAMNLGETLGIFSVRGGFFVGNWEPDALDATNGIALNTVFSASGDNNFEGYYLGFIPDEAGYSTVYIGKIVPEPTTATLSLLALAALAARRRRR